MNYQSEGQTDRHFSITCIDNHVDNHVDNHLSWTITSKEHITLYNTNIIYRIVVFHCISHYTYMPCQAVQIRKKVTSL